jgi:hypothetical protein
MLSLIRRLWSTYLALDTLYEVNSADLMIPTPLHSKCYIIVHLAWSPMLRRWEIHLMLPSIDLHVEKIAWTISMESIDSFVDKLAGNCRHSYNWPRFWGGRLQSQLRLIDESADQRLRMIDYYRCVFCIPCCSIPGSNTRDSCGILADLIDRSWWIIKCNRFTSNITVQYHATCRHRLRCWTVRPCCDCDVFAITI